MNVIPFLCKRKNPLNSVKLRDFSMSNTYDYQQSEKEMSVSVHVYNFLLLFYLLIF
jgi:hypothetical protein